MLFLQKLILYWIIGQATQTQKVNILYCISSLFVSVY